MPVEITQRWRDLAEKRRAHLVELFDSGRWKRYYNEEQLVARTREAVRLVEIWDQLATPPGAAKAITKSNRAFSGKMDTGFP